MADRCNEFTYISMLCIKVFSGCNNHRTNHIQNKCTKIFVSLEKTSAL